MESDPIKIRYTYLGNTGERVSEIGLGTYGITNYKKAEAAFSYAIERGVNLIDTAEIYNTEDFVGSIIKRFGRDKLFIITKVWPKNLTTKESTIKSARGSLSKLGTDYVDLILIHWPHKNMSIRDQVRNIEAVQKEGLSRFIGVSNFSVEQMEEARNSTASAEIVCNEVKYNLEEREIEEGVLPYSQKKKISVIAYTPLANGNVSKGASFLKIMNETGRTPIQISLNFILSHPGVIPIPKTENIDHMKDILGSVGWSLSTPQLNLLNEA